MSGHKMRVSSALLKTLNPLRPSSTVTSFTLLAPANATQRLKNALRPIAMTESLHSRSRVHERSISIFTRSRSYSMYLVEPLSKPSRLANLGGRVMCDQDEKPSALTTRNRSWHECCSRCTGLASFPGRLSSTCVVRRDRV
jgi:hypothetical protein